MFPVVNGVNVATFSTLLVQLFSKPVVAGLKSDFSMFFNALLSKFYHGSAAARCRSTAATIPRASTSRRTVAQIMVTRCMPGPH